jgi:hypothetical protein
LRGAGVDDAQVGVLRIEADQTLRVALLDTESQCLESSTGSDFRCVIPRTSFLLLSR